MTTHWYALRSKPHKEALLHKQVLAREIECFFPRIQVIPKNPRASRLRPYFPGYIFVRTDMDETGLNTFKWMPYAQNLVSFDRIPAIVPDQIIQQIISHLEEINAQGGLKPDEPVTGEKIIVEEGPFSGCQGIFDARLRGSERVRVLLQFLNDRQVPVELDMDQLSVQKKR